MSDKKEKRLSILKPGKSRHPLGDVEIRVEEEDATTTVKAKRVSFASSNQIKKFTADDEKNTIWDSTYEECVEISDNSPFSLNMAHVNKSAAVDKENIKITACGMASDEDLEFTPPVGGSTINVTGATIAVEQIVVDQTSFGNSTMEFTNIADNINNSAKEVKQPGNGENTMEFTEAISSNIVEFGERTEMNKTVICDEGLEMEFTSVIHGNLSDNISIVDMSVDEVEMSLMQLDNLQDIQTGSSEIARTQSDVSVVKCMELTTAVQSPHLNVNPNNTDNRDVIDRDACIGNLNNTNINTSSVTMEFTTAINGLQFDTIEDNNKNNENYTVKDNGDIKKTEVNVSSIDMEFTTAVNGFIPGDKNNYNRQQDGNDVSVSIEYTRAVNDLQLYTLKNNDNNNDIPQDGDNRIIIDSNANTSSVYMEFTTPINGFQGGTVQTFANNDNHQQSGNSCINLIDLNVSSVNNNGNEDNCQDKGDGIDDLSGIVELATVNSLLSGIAPFDDSHQHEAIHHSYTSEQHDTSRKNNNQKQTGVDLTRNIIGDITSVGLLPNDHSQTMVLHSVLENLSSHDTSELIDCRLNEKSQTLELSRVAVGDLNPSFSNLRYMPLGQYTSDSFHVTLNDVLKPSKSGINALNETISNTKSVCDVMETMDDTANTLDLCNTQPPDNLHETMLSFDASTTPMSPVRNVDEPPPFEGLELPKCYDMFRIKPAVSMKDYSGLEEACEKLNVLISKKVEAWKKLCARVHNTTISEDSNSSTANAGISNMLNEQSIDSYDLSLSDIGEAEKSINLKIRDLQGSNKRYWQLLSIDNLTYKFATLFRTIFLTVHLEENSDKVEAIEIEKVIRDSFEPEALYAHKVFCDRLSPKYIKAALGDKYDVRSLLDFVKETMHKLLVFLREYDQLFDKYRMMMYKNFRIEFSITRVNLLISWKFAINMLELDYISDKTVEYCAKVGPINDKDIRKCMEECPTGTPFVRAFVENLYNLVNRMENSRK